ncbi:putative ubiquinone biosynthesis protein UbiB [Tetraselmis virus 1]|uniref:Putative ubiquinone biosynthesis protein UbiB n=1 Tax=Tetraselmis virus 1 TaxID=2060617 RepID=A0A2P0VMP1_9VIRU|nr:putative ubiquinone biosynthesis protein UbiB [Tetraselmis virus 1]AUF82152.1 putative ubiquinone biosynthesis protein UbiB [Tetraselmis virus 1]
MLQVGKVIFSAGEVAITHVLDKNMAAQLAAHRAQDLGPSFIKLGQFVSTRADVLSEAYCKEFAKLRDDTRPDSYQTIQKNVKNYLGISDLNEVFAEFDREPIASASVAQVHKAVLKKGNKTVAVKILKNGVREGIEKDLATARRVCELLPKKYYAQINLAVERYSKVLRKELDFITESKNAIIAKNVLSHSLGSEVIIPKPLYSTDGVIIMEYVPSSPITKAKDIRRITNLVLETILVLITSGAAFHQDPHEGNLGVVCSEGEEKLVLYDFGNVSKLSSNAMDGIIDAGLAFFEKNEDSLVKTLLKYNLVSITDDKSKIALKEMVKQSFEYIKTMNINSFDIHEIDKDSAHDIIAAPEVNNIMRSVIMAEGVCKSAYNGFNLEASIDQFFAIHFAEIAGKRAERDIFKLFDNFIN